MKMKLYRPNILLFAARSRAFHFGRLLLSLTGSLALAIVIAQFVLVAPALRAGGSEPTAAQVLAPEPILVAGGTGTQTEPHVSGSLVSFTNAGSTTSEIRYKDVATTSPSAGVDNSTPTGSTYRDSISDVSGSVIVFKRASDTSSTESIMFFDSANPSAGAQVLAEAPGTQRQAAAIGNTTVAFEQKTSSSLVRDICVADISTPSDAATCLTASDMMNRDPAVSPDGNTVVWAKCTGLSSGCDIWAVSKNAAGGWDAPRAITTGGGNDLLPDTNGVVVTYASNLDGDSDIYYSNLDGTGLTSRIALADSGGSSEENPNISGTRISFQRRAAIGQAADLYVYHLVSDTLYQLTDTPADEKLSDISTDSSGRSWVVWAAVDPATNSDDVWAASFWLPEPVPETSFEVCPLFDQSRSHRLGSTVPVRIQLCEPDGTNLSSPSLVVTATALAKVDGTASTAVAADSGHANPDNDFRYDDSLQGYIYNLATRGLSSGTWELQFTVTGEPATYAVRFDIR
jgi:hypothetical protein